MPDVYTLPRHLFYCRRSNMTLEYNMQQEQLALKAEILSLEEKLLLPIPPELQKLLKSNLQKISEELCDVHLFDEVDYLQNQLNTLRCLTNITIKDVYKSQQKDGYAEKIKGEILGSEFKLNFSTSHVKKDSHSDPHVKTLNIEVKKYIPNHIKQFIKGCEKNCCIKDFFHGFVNYKKWCKLKENTFNHFKDKYPDLVNTTGNEEDPMLEVATPNERYIVKWDNLISDKLLVQPVVDLYIETCVTGSDVTHQHLSDKFQHLVTKHGVETAIETLISSLAKHQ